MKKSLCALLICAALIITGCGGAGTPDAALSESAKSKAKTQETAATSEVTEEETDTDKDAASSADASEETAKQQSQAAQESGSEENDTENDTEKDSGEDAVKEEASEDGAGAQETEGTEEAEETEKKEEAQASEEQPAEAAQKGQAAQKGRELPPQYVPEGFAPYGNYLLVYDSGYEVKTRLSAAGLTYYYGSEEFLFTLNKDLPDMEQQVAHILFNTQAPMDPADTDGEEFPFGENYVIYITLDNGSYYEVYSSSLDLEGRVFVRDIFELFREKWEGAF